MNVPMLLPPQECPPSKDLPAEPHALRIVSTLDVLHNYFFKGKYAPRYVRCLARYHPALCSLGVRLELFNSSLTPKNKKIPPMFACAFALESLFLIFPRIPEYQAEAFLPHWQSGLSQYSR